MVQKKHVNEASPTHTLGLYELKEHKPWFYEEYSQSLFQREQAKYSCLQDPNQSSVQNLNNVKSLSLQTV